MAPTVSAPKHAPGKDPWVLPTALFAEYGEMEQRSRTKWGEQFGDRWTQEPTSARGPPLSLFVDMPDSYLKYQREMKGAQVRSDYGRESHRPASWRPQNTGRSVRSRPSTGKASWRNKTNRTHRSNADGPQPSWRSKGSSRPPTSYSRPATGQSWQSRPCTGSSSKRSHWYADGERSHRGDDEQDELEELRTNLRSAGAQLEQTMSSVGSRAGTKVAGFGPIR